MALCGNCAGPTKNSLHCDTCSQWICCKCINNPAGSITTELYRYLIGKTFGWNCPRCSDIPLPVQLLAGGTISRTKLVELGIAESFLKQHSAPTPATTTAPATSGSEVTPAGGLGADVPPQITETLEQAIQRQCDASLSAQLLKLLQDSRAKQPSPPPPSGPFPISTAPIPIFTSAGLFSLSGQQHSLGGFSAQPHIFTTTQRPPVPQFPPPPQIPPPGISSGTFGGPIPPPSLHDSMYQDPLYAVPHRAPQENPSKKSVLSSLTTLKLPVFTGKPGTWQSWWETFHCVVHEADAPKLHKWMALRDCVRGPPLRKIECLANSYHNYDAALNILYEEYGTMATTVADLWMELDSIKPVTKDWRNLEDYIDNVRARYIALTHAGVLEQAVDGYATVQYMRLPENLQAKLREDRETRQFEGRFSDARSPWTFKEFLGRLKAIQKYLPSSHTQRGGGEFHGATAALPTPEEASFLVQTQAATKGHPQHKRRSEDNQNQKRRTIPPCLFCNKEDDHYSDSCKVVTDFGKRKGIAMEKKVCFKCLRPTSSAHYARICQRNKPCRICSSTGHHTALHQPRKSNVASPPAEERKQQQQQQQKPEKSEQSHHCMAQSREEPQVEFNSSIMATFKAFAVNPTTGKRIKANVYLDGGAELSSITQTCSEALDLVPLQRVELNTATFGQTDLKKITAHEVQFKLLSDSGYALTFHALAVPALCSPMIRRPITFPPDVERIVDEYQVINAPPKCKEEFHVDILVGQDYLNLILHPTGGRVVQLPASLRIHVTPYGAILTGSMACEPLSKRKQKKLRKSVMITHVGDVSTLWSLDSIGLQAPAYPCEKTPDPVEEYFEQNVTQDADGHYRVRLPFKSGAHIETNFNVAVKRLQMILKTLCPQGEPTEKFWKYNEIFEDQLKQGFTTKVGVESSGPITHYVAHFPVIKESSTFTKIRIVVDPSQKTQSGICLNDLLETGPNLMENLCGMLLKFRLHKFQVVMDFEKAYMQIRVAEQDQDAVRFLWLADPTKITLENNIQRYKFISVSFGLSCSPFLLLATLRHHFKQHPGTMAERWSLYMDNALRGFDEDEDCLIIYKETKDYFKAAGFNAREWESNYPGFKEAIPLEDRAKPGDCKVLGMKWDHKKDVIFLQKLDFDSATVTKRLVLSRIASVFDVLGLFNPITIRGRILFQQLWKLGIHWDDPLPPEELQTWLQIQEDLLHLHELKLPRRVTTSEDPIYLLCFTDASSTAYAAVIYLHQAGNTVLLMSKARVNPLKPVMTIPRLELTAIVIGTRLLTYVRQQLQIQVAECHLWSDSQIALQQISGQKSTDAWVLRRVQEVQTFKGLQLHHCQGSDNPADLATRPGVTLENICSTIWFNGPSWLSNQDKWTESTVNFETPAEPPVETNIESATLPAIVSKVVKSTPIGPFGIASSKFSSLNRLLRVTSCCRRFVNLARKQVLPAHITASELERSRLEWVRSVQQNHFSEEIEGLRSKKLTQRSRQLDLFLDPEGTIRVASRLANAPIRMSAKYPALLPKEDHFTVLVVTEAHEAVAHFKGRSTLTKVRERYWIPQGQTVVDRIIRLCIVCRKSEGEAFRPPDFPPYPAERVSKSPAFRFAAMDFMGPILVRPHRGVTFEKRWIMLVTCMSTRAIHLEVVPGCSTTDTLRAIQRFVSRRGTPRLLLTDNQPGFLKTAKALKLLWDDLPDLDENLHVYFAKQGINWTTVAPKSPWLNAISERLVQTVKRALRKALFKITLDDDAFQTLVIQIEAIVNSRPLLRPSSDVDDPVITPASFIAPSSSLCLPPVEGDLEDPDWTTTDQTNDLQCILTEGQSRLDAFWRCFLEQYLQTLRDTARFPAKRGEVPRQPEVGETCLLREPGSRRTWPLVRIEELLPSGDDELRVARIRTSTGFSTRRAVRDLIPLEFTGPTNSTFVTEVPPGPSTDVGPTEDASESVSKEPPQTPMESSTITARPFSPRLLRSGRVLLFFLGLVTCFGFGSAETAAQMPEFNLCLGGAGGRKLILPKQVDCVHRDHTEHFQVNVTLFVPNHSLPNSSAFLCYFETTTVCTVRGFFDFHDWNAIVEPARIFRNYTEIEKCRIVSHSLLFENMHLVKHELLPNTWTTGKRAVPTSKWYSRTCTSVTNFIVEKGEVASHDGKSVVSSLMGTEHCRLEEGSCILSETTLVWSLRNIARYCPFTIKGRYNADYDKEKHVVIIPELQSAFHLKHQTGQTLAFCIRPHSYLTMEGSIVYFGFHPQEYVERIDTRSIRKEKSDLEILRHSMNFTSTEEDPVNAKLSYLADWVGREMERRKQDMYAKYCLLLQTSLRFHRGLIQLDPTLGVRVALDRQDISAEIVNGEILIFACHRVRPTKIHFDHVRPDTGRCSELLPVSLGDEIWFVDQMNVDLIRNSPDIPCSAVHYRTKIGTNDSTISLPVFQPHYGPRTQLPVFSSPPLFKAKVMYPPNVLKLFSSQVATLDRRLEATINFTSCLSSNPDVLRQLLTGLGDMGKNFLEGAGHGIGALVHDSLDGLGAFAGQLLSPTFIFVSSIFACIALTAFLLLMSYHMIQSIIVCKRKRAFDKSNTQELPS